MVVIMKAQIDRTKCVGCGACISACPSGAISMMPGWHSRVDQSKCTGCGTCVSLCHKKAPKLIDRSPEEGASEHVSEET